MRRLVILVLILLPFSGLFTSVPTFFFDDAIINTVIQVLVIVSLNVWLSIGTAWWLLFTETKWRTFIEWFLFLPLFIPALAGTFGMYIALARFGLVGTTIGVLIVLLVVTLPYSIRLAYNAMSVIGRPMFEQALFMPPLRRYRDVLFPLLSGTIQTIALMSTVIVLGQFVLIQLIGAGLISTVTTRLYQVYAGNDVALALQHTWLLILIPAVLYIAIGWGIRLGVKIVKGRL